MLELEYIALVRNHLDRSILANQDMTVLGLVRQLDVLRERLVQPQEHLQEAQLETGQASGGGESIHHNNTEVVVISTRHQLQLIHIFSICSS